MATTLPHPPGTGAPPSGPPLERIPVESARSALAVRESPRRRIIRLVLVVIALAVLVKGWAVTDIDLGKLANAPNAAPILKALFQPDVATRDVTPDRAASAVHGGWRLGRAGRRHH